MYAGQVEHVQQTTVYENVYRPYDDICSLLYALVVNQFHKFVAIIVSAPESLQSSNTSSLFLSVPTRLDDQIVARELAKICRGSSICHWSTSAREASVKIAQAGALEPV